MRKAIFAVLSLGAILSSPSFAADSTADELGWPRVISAADAKITVYQPQPDSLKDDQLSGRAVVAIETSGSDSPMFGSAWISARLSVDRDHRLATLTAVKVTQVKFPDLAADKAAGLEKLLETELAKWEPSIDLDQLLATLSVAEVQQKQAKGLNNDPPVIKYVDHPALLVSLDGKPIYKQVENSNLTRVVNTPFMILLDYRTSDAYLFDGRDWLYSTDVMGPWKASSVVPPEIVDQSPGDRGTQSIEKALEDESSAPEIIVATEPTELIVTTGAAKYSDIEGTDLSYVSNTESRLLKEKSSGMLYVLLSGRWYSSSALSGPWSYVSPSELPADFTKIPPDSEIGEVLTSVPGTRQAQDALLAAQVPRTATVKRDQTIAVQYDGPPRWEPIDGTQMQFATNSAQSVIRLAEQYFAVDIGVWYNAGAPTGPWAVAVDIPDDIYTIPAESPVYNSTYVNVFGYTDDEAYVGYYPGYYGSYAYDDTLVYGTGYDYRPWIGNSYYSRPAT